MPFLNHSFQRVSVPVGELRKQRIPTRSPGCSRRLDLALSAIVVFMLLAAVVPAAAADFTVSNEAELLQAIDDANASADASSTITLANSFTITGSGLSSIAKDIEINMAGHKLTSSFDTSFDVSEGATLTLNGSLEVAGSSGFFGNMIKTGEGNLRIKGGPSDVFWRVKTEEGLVIFDEGAVFTFGDYFGDAANVQSMVDAGAGLRVTGPGTIVTNRYTSVVQSDSGSSIDVHDGAIFNSKGVRLAATDNSSGTLNIDDALVNTEDLHVQSGSGSVNVLNGGMIYTGTTRTGVIIDDDGMGIEDKGGTGSFLVSGAGSKWINDGFFMMTRGSLDILDGGSLETRVLRLGHFDNELTKDAVAKILVAGAGSTLSVTGEESEALAIGGGVGAMLKSGSLTVADGGSVIVDEGRGTINIATLPSSSGAINIGGEKAAAPKATGEIRAGRIEFGPGTGEINFNHTEQDYSFDIPLIGNGNLHLSGPGTTTMLADQRDFTGTTSIENGSLAVNGWLGGSMHLKGGRLSGTGTVGPLLHEEGGILAPGNSPGVLTIDGGYTGNGGLIEIETVLGNDASPTDKLKITGDSSGTADVNVANLGGTGAPTVEGIKIIEVDGASNALFSLQGSYLLDNQPAIVAGAYAYRLYQNGISTPTDGDWYLRSTSTTTPGDEDPDDGNGNGGGGGNGGNGDGGGNGGDGNGSSNGHNGGGNGNGEGNGTPLYQAGVPLYQSYPAVLQRINHLPTLQQRTGNRHQNYDYNAYPAQLEDGGYRSRHAEKPTVWTRINGAHTHSTSDKSTIGTTGYSLHSWRFDSGIEGLLVENGGRLIGGISGHHVRTTAQISSAHGNGTADITGAGIGATLTWYGDDGFYLDAGAQATWYRSRLRSTTASRTLVADNHGFGYALSAETGLRINMNDHVSLTPQAQLTYSSVTFDRFVDSFGATVSPRRGENLALRIGLEVNHETFWEAADGKAGANIYTIANLHYAMHERNSVTVSGVNFHAQEPRGRASIGLGGSLNWGDGKFGLHGEVSHQFALARGDGRNHVTRGELGLKIRF